MGVRFPQVSSNTLLSGVLTQNTEMAVVTSPPLNISLDNAQVQIFWFYVMTLAAGTTAVSYRIRRGSGVAGTQVNVNSIIAEVASTVICRSGTYIDTPGVVAGQQYSLTVLTVAAGAAGTIQDACITVMSL